MIYISTHIKKYTFEELSKERIGRWFGVVSEINVFLFCFGCLVAYVVIIGEIICPIFEYWYGSDFILSNKSFTTGVVLLIVNIDHKKDNFSVMHF
jgi:amino acid permease